MKKEKKYNVISLILIRIKKRKIRLIMTCVSYYALITVLIAFFFLELRF